MNNISQWIEDNQLDVSILNNIYKIKGVGTFYIVESTDGKIFDEEFRLILSQTEKDIKCDYFLFEFGGKWFYTPKSHTKRPEMLLFKYLGEAKLKYKTKFPYLGIHGKFEILNGSREYSDWCKKAKFYGYTTLGICEKNTMAGIVEFQLVCYENNIKSILGMSIDIRFSDGNIGSGKIYILNDKGWENALVINKNVNVDNGRRFVDEKVLLKHGEGLVFVFGWTMRLSTSIIKNYIKSFTQTYYQIDSPVFENDDYDKKYLNAVSQYINKYTTILSPILINDSYYLDKEDNHIKKTINDIAGVSFEGRSKNQHFKSLDESVVILEELFDTSDDRLFQIIKDAIKNVNQVEKTTTFQIGVGTFKYPKFDYNRWKEEYGCTSSEDLLWLLIESNLKKIPKLKTTEYLERVDHEMDVIIKGGFVDYFLILWDIIKWANTNGILTGIARGSAGGSLVSYLIDITRIDPIKYGLLFERFLNEGRMKTSPADIDVDFEGLRREEVKQYMRETYGQDQVCSVGTYPSLQVKASIKDLSRIKNIPHVEVNYITKMISNDVNHWNDIFIDASKKARLKDFIKKNVDIVNDTALILGQPKTVSIHPCATLILPKNKTIFEWIPVRRDGDELVSEWEGKYLETVGFLKEDILGIQQLDKFRLIINLIEKTEKKKIDLYNLPIDDKGVYEFFQKGYTEDVFHFGSESLKAYSQQVKPKNIHELIIMNAIYRPGPIQTGAHDDYVKLKNRVKYPTYDYGLKDVTKDTYGLWVFQEQIMKAVQTLGDFNLAEADDIRKAMGKLKKKLIHSYKEQFLTAAINKGCPNKEANQIWDKLEVFAGYSFNKSHAAAYSIMGYTCQWLKYYYPIQFWTSAFEFGHDDQLPGYLSEIYRSNIDVTLMPPDINKSQKNLYTDFTDKKIYWSLLKIKQVAEVAAELIIKERLTNGEYFSISEFFKRLPKNKVNKRVVEHLTLAGSFDNLYNIKRSKDRIKIIEEYRKAAKIIKINPEKDIFTNNTGIKRNYWWAKKQLEVSGLGFIDYTEVVDDSSLKLQKSKLISSDEFFLDSNRNKDVIIGGIIREIKEKKSRKGPFAEITIDSNYITIIIICWSEVWKDVREDFISNEGEILLTSGIIKEDDWKKLFVLQVNKKDKMLLIS